MHTKTYFQLRVLTVTVGVSLYFHSFFCQIHSYPNFPESLVNDGLVLHGAHLDNAKRQRTLTGLPKTDSLIVQSCSAVITQFQNHLGWKGPSEIN